MIYKLDTPYKFSAYEFGVNAIEGTNENMIAKLVEGTRYMTKKYIMHYIDTGLPVPELAAKTFKTPWEAHRVARGIFHRLSVEQALRDDLEGIHDSNVHYYEKLFHKYGKWHGRPIMDKWIRFCEIKPNEKFIIAPYEDYTHLDSQYIYVKVNGVLAYRLLDKKQTKVHPVKLVGTILEGTF